MTSTGTTVATGVSTSMCDNYSINYDFVNSGRQKAGWTKSTYNRTGIVIPKNSLIVLNYNGSNAINDRRNC